MKKRTTNALLTVLLVAASLAIYLFQLAEFRTPRDTAFYFLQDMAFLPLQAAAVTILLGKVLSNREKRERLQKINMAISAFFSEAGTAVMIRLAGFSRDPQEIRTSLRITAEWTGKDFRAAARQLKKRRFPVVCRTEELPALKALLVEKRRFLLAMLGNPNLMEHDTFSDMLWAVFHLADELSIREDFADLTEEDALHLANDIERALGAILVQWVNHLAHLQVDYPYLFSLELRRNPLHGGNGAIVIENEPGVKERSR